MVSQHSPLQPDAHAGATAASSTPGAPTPRLQWSVPQVILTTVIIVGVAILTWLLLRFRGSVALLLLAIVAGTVIRPTIEWLSTKGVPRGLALVTIYVLAIGIALGLLVLLFPLAAQQILGIAADVPRYYVTVRTLMVNSSSRLVQRIGTALPLFLPSTGQPSPGQGLEDVGTFLQYAGLVAGWGLALSGFLLASFYWAAESRRIIQRLLLLAPIGRREELRSLVGEIEAQVGAYVRVQALLSASVGIASFVAYSLVGLPYTLVLGLVSGVTELIPVLGPLLGAGVAVVVALATDPSKAGWTLVAAALIQQLENNILVPQLVRGTLGLSPVVTILALATLGSLLGVPGALLAAPLTAATELLIRRLVLTGEQDEARTAVRDRVGALRYQAQQIIDDVRQQVKRKEELPTATSDQAEDDLESIASAIDGILAHFEQERIGG